MVLNEIAIEKLVFCNKQISEVKLHLRCEASETGYASCVYVVFLTRKVSFNLA